MNCVRVEFGTANRVSTCRASLQSIQHTVQNEKQMLLTVVLAITVVVTTITYLNGSEGNVN